MGQLDTLLVFFNVFALFSASLNLWIGAGIRLARFTNASQHRRFVFAISLINLIVQKIIVKNISLKIFLFKKIFVT